MQSKSCASELVLANRSKNQEVLRITRLHLHHKKRIRSLSRAIEGPQAAERQETGGHPNHGFTANEIDARGGLRTPSQVTSVENLDCPLTVQYRFPNVPYKAFREPPASCKLL